MSGITKSGRHSALKIACFFFVLFLSPGLKSSGDFAIASRGVYIDVRMRVWSSLVRFSSPLKS